MGCFCMEVLGKIKRLRDECGWSDYKLAQEAGLRQSTISSMFKKNNNPTIQTLEALCKAFGLTLSQFFADGNVPVDLTDEQKMMLENWNMLTNEQKKALLNLLKCMN